MKLVVLNKEEINIEPGASLSRMSTEIEKYTDLENLENKLTKENLKVANLVEEDVTVSTYTNMCVIDPLFLITKKDGKMFATFGLRNLTESELQEEDVQTALTYLTDEQALAVKNLHEEWVPNKDYKTGDRRLYNEKLYKCLQDHTAQEDWNPEDAPSLWAEILIPDPEVIPEWKQPESTNGYSTGDKVTHNGKTWESLVDNNIWEPGVVGTEGQWKEVMEES